jgi:hypothetical protein
MWISADLQDLLCDKALTLIVAVALLVEYADKIGQAI